MTKEIFSPRPVGTPPREITLTGKYLGWANGMPWLMRVVGSEDYFVPLFSDSDVLRSMVAQVEDSIDTVKKVDDGLEFLDSIPEEYDGKKLRVMLDPRFVDGKVRYLEIQR